MSLPARPASRPEAVMDPAGLARGQAPGPLRGRAPALAPGTPGSVSAKPARLSLIAGHAHPGRRRTSSQPDPARSMTRIRQPDSGKPRAHQIVWETGEAQGSAAGAGKSGSSVDDLAPDSVRAAPGLRVVWHGGRGSRSDFLSYSFSGSWQAARVSAVCSALLSCISGRGCLCREPARPASASSPARRAAARRWRGDRGGRRCRLRNGIRQTCARRLLPATTWPLRRGRASCGCSWASP